MAKERRRKLSDAAIAFIIEKRNDPLTVYTFDEIVELLAEKFKVTISRQGVNQSYEKHKDDATFKTLEIVEDSEDNLKIQKKRKVVSDVPKPLKSKRVNEPIIPVIIEKDFDEDAGKNYDVNDFFMK